MNNDWSMDVQKQCFLVGSFSFPLLRVILYPKQNNLILFLVHLPKRRVRQNRNFCSGITYQVNVVSIMSAAFGAFCLKSYLFRNGALSGNPKAKDVAQKPGSPSQILCVPFGKHEKPLKKSYSCSIRQPFTTSVRHCDTISLDVRNVSFVKHVRVGVYEHLHENIDLTRRWSLASHYQRFSSLYL